MKQELVLYINDSKNSEDKATVSKLHDLADLYILYSKGWAAWVDWK